MAQLPQVSHVRGHDKPVVKAITVTGFGEPVALAIHSIFTTPSRGQLQCLPNQWPDVRRIRRTSCNLRHDGKRQTSQLCARRYTIVSDRVVKSAAARSVDS